MTTTTDSLRALAQTLVEAGRQVQAVEEERDEWRVEPDVAPVLAKLADYERRRKEAKATVDALDADVRAGIENAYLEAELRGEELALPAGLGIQWRSEPSYTDEFAARWIVAGYWLHDQPAMRNAARRWLLDAIAKCRPALNRIIMEFRPRFADCTSKRLVPTVSETLGAKLEAASGGPPESMAEWQTRDRRKHGETVSKLVAEQWGQRGE